VAFEADSEWSGGRTTPARDDVRKAEAARILDVLETANLPARAQSWLAGGIDTPNVRALAGLADSPEVSDGVRRALVAEIASDLGITFDSLQDARRIHAEHIIQTMSQGANLGPQIFALSNGVTDELTGRLRRVIDRLRRRS
jgi:hypothetical protein